MKKRFINVKDKVPISTLKKKSLKIQESETDLKDSENRFHIENATVQSSGRQTSSSSKLLHR